MAHGFFNRVWCSTTTTGTGDVEIGTAKPAHCTPDDAGTVDGDTLTWLLEDGNDFEIFRGAYTTSGALVTRGTVLLSQISGASGTTRLDLSGTATIRCVSAAEDLLSIVNTSDALTKLGGTTVGKTVFTAPDAGAAMTAIGGIDASNPVSITGTTTLTGAALGAFHVISGTSASYTVTLPTPVGNAGKSLWLQVAGPSAASKLYTIATPAGTIDGEASRIMWASESALLWSDGTNWFKLMGRSIPLTGSVSRNTDQSLVSGTTWQGVTFTAGNDPAGLNLAFDSVNGYLVAPRPGAWMLTFSGVINQSSTPTFTQVEFTVNSVEAVSPWNDSINGLSSYINYSGSVLLDAGDYCQTALRANGTSPYLYGSGVTARMFYVESPLW